MAYASATKGLFDMANIFRRRVFGFSNALRPHKADLPVSSQPAGHLFGGAPWGRMLLDVADVGRYRKQFVAGPAPDLTSPFGAPRRVCSEVNCGHYGEGFP
jgi:hypothetical protein